MDDLDALLADLQNTVPGGGLQQQQQHHQHQMQYSNSNVMPHHQGNNIYQSTTTSVNATPGYGSLNGVRSKQSPQSPTYQQTHQMRVVQNEQNVTPSSFVNYSNGNNVVNLSPTTGPLNGGNNSGGYQTVRTTVTTQQQQHGGNNYSGSLPRSAPHQQQQHAAAVGNLSELDSLLQDLSNARYGNTMEKKVEQHHTYGSSGMINNGKNSPVSPYAIISDVTKRPSVDSLLDELSNAHNNPSTSPIYATPNGASSPDYSTIGKTPGRHVTITVRETKTEKMTGSPSPVPASPSYTNSNNQQIFETIQTQTMQNQQQQQPPSQSPAQFASSATKELDDLMASLSDFKINASSHKHQKVVTEYAKPIKGISHLHSTTITSTTEQQHQPQHPQHHIQQYQQGDQLDSILGNLQANMSRQGVTTAQKGCCNACEKPIVGQVITALGKTWHPEHFTCNHCSQELGTRNFFERDGYPYCEPDYHNLFSPRCAYCNGPILDKCVTALEKTWHTEHFFCAQCGQQFGEDGFHERDGKPYCRNDYFDMFAPKCNGCNRAIMENYISALNSQWHPDCFVCRDCRLPFQDGSFFDHEGLPYCETHYHAKRGSLCAGCSKPITGRCITAMFKKFHPEHFVCAFCLKQLNKGTFKEQNDKPYCHGCFDKLFG